MVDSISLRKSFDDTGFVFKNASNKVTSDADVQRAAQFACKDIDEVALAAPWRVLGATRLTGQAGQSEDDISKALAPPTIIENSEYWIPRMRGE